MHGYYPNNVVKEVNDLLAIPAAEQAIGVTWGKIMEILEQQVSPPIKSDLVLLTLFATPEKSQWHHDQRAQRSK